MINIRIKLFLLAGTLFFFLALRFQGSGLQQPFAPKGIISLELASTNSQAETIIIGWTEQGLIKKARNNIWLDFFFIPFYVMLFYTFCGSISIRLHALSAKLGVLLAFFSLIAGLFDILENLLMLFATYGVHNDITTLFTAFFALSKFILLGLSLIYVIFFGIPVLAMLKKT